MTGEIRAQLIDAHGRHYGSGIELADGVVTAIDTDVSTETAAVLFPGFVDVHCHGGGGYSFPDDHEASAIKAAADIHLAGGTTTLIASTVSLHDPLPAIRALADACEAGVLGGIHLEGPYISHDKPGAQNPEAIRPGDTDEYRTWLEAGRGWIKTMTIAPEIDGALDLVELGYAYGVRPSWGHTNATGQVTANVLQAAAKLAAAVGISAPVQSATHLFNAMPPLHHRFPGPVREFLSAAVSGQCAVEIIGDGVHLDIDLVTDLLRILDVGEPSVALVTDAMAGAGMPDGHYELGGLPVTISGGVATLTGGGAIAGGTARLGDEVAKLLGLGIPPELLARAASGTPARIIGHGPQGPATVGEPLTGVLMDGESRRVFRDGVEVGLVG